jgi:hypothetical protein
MKKARQPITKKAKAKTLLINISVQITEELDARLAREVAKTGLSKNLVARQAILAAVQMMERDGGLYLPLSFPKD